MDDTDFVPMDLNIGDEERDVETIVVEEKDEGTHTIRGGKLVKPKKGLDTSDDPYKAKLGKKYPGLGPMDDAQKAAEAAATTRKKADIYENGTSLDIGS